MERMHEYKGVYHVLHGALSPLEGVGRKGDAGLVAEG